MTSKEFSVEIGGKQLVAQFSDLAEQASGSAIVRYGNTTVLATAVMSKQTREGDFFPLTVDYEERFYAAGQILGSRFIRREGRPTEEAILSGRVVDRTIRRLEEWGFITMASSDFVSADELEERGVRPTSLGMRVAQLYLDPLTAHQLILGLGSHRGLSAFAALQLLSSTLEMRPALRVKVKEYDLIQDALLQHHDKLLVEEPTLYDEEYDAFLASVKTALMLHEWTEEKDEPYLLETFDVRPGELKVKLQTADWLLYAMVELCKLLGFKELLAELMKIRVRLEYGVREELLPLLKLKGIGRVRSRQLFAAGFKTLGHLKAAPAGALERVLGEKLGQSVREQLEGKTPREQKPEQQASLSGY